MIQRLLLSVITFASVGLIQAASVTISNPSFEDPDLTGGGATWSNTIGGAWVERDAVDDPDSFIEFIGGFSADGVQHVGMASGYYISQDLGVAWTPNTTYTLTVAYGRRNGSFADPANASTFGLLNFVPTMATHATAADVVLDAGALIIGAENAFPLDDLTFADGQVVFNTGAVAPSGNVVVFLGANSPNRSHFDNIRLDASPIPEPSVGLLAGLAGLALLRRRR